MALGERKDLKAGIEVAVKFSMVYTGQPFFQWHTGIGIVSTITYVVVSFYKNIKYFKLNYHYYVICLSRNVQLTKFIVTL